MGFQPPAALLLRLLLLQGVLRLLWGDLGVYGAAGTSLSSLLLSECPALRSARPWSETPRV
ncbi:TCTN2 isoform 4 [Pongo abelii]|uniref:TCTN2 isoform 4 n=1 Tax=Pongo abelii TaxID=9601 RepID=A0A2J8XJ11_PONAB|nr:TCTN2 isoform 4 [Pongo abelii]